jgi:acyl-homoserine-lactone acylase
MVSRRILISLLAGVLVSPLLISASGSAQGSREPAARSSRYAATITWTKHGIPHIKARDFGSLGFGSGYAVARTSACTLADTIITARGQRSRYFGPDATYDDQVSMSGSNLQIDALVTDLRNRKVVEKLLSDPRRGPSARARRLVRGYVAGGNAWLRKVGPDGVTDPACKGASYLRTRTTELDLWYGVYISNILASSGRFVKEIVDAAPPLAGAGVPALPKAGEVDRDALRKALGRDPESTFGSNATAVGGMHTTTGRGMLLGNPHFPWRGRYRFTQQHLTIPGRYDVAGASLVGSPAVNIGWNKQVAWSHTVSTAYRFTPYEYKLVTPTTYLTTEGPTKMTRRVVSVTVRKPDGSLGRVTEDLYRTREGYVVNAAATLMPWTPLSAWALRDANAEHLRTIDTFLAMGQARGAADLLRRQDRWGGMPWVNTIAAGRGGGVLYADHSVVPNVPNSLATACLTPTGALLYQLVGLPGLDGTRAGGGCAWRTDADASRPGVFGPANLPKTLRRDWVINANDSYWLPNPAAPLEGHARIIGCERCERSLRTRMVYRYVQDRIAGVDGLAAGRRVSPRSLRATQHANRVYGAELMRQGDALDRVCELAQGDQACDVLSAWDGRSDTTSVGTHIFEQFVARLPAAGVWLTPFAAADPVNTPRDLNVANPLVVKAMSDAIAFLKSKGVAMDAPWGSLQVAGDRGAPPIPIGGGSGAAGNANAVASRTPLDNVDRLSPVTYGSSHIQAVAYMRDGRVQARTILTYSQSENPRSPWSADQTRLFSRERWVAFPWTPRQIAAARISRITVRG